jgi:sugar diacid utilization regulator
VVFRRVPSPLLDEARTRRFPVFGVPLRTPFRDVISTINRALLSTDLRMLQRISSMQLYLMDALGEADSRQAVVERLSAFLDATVLLFSSDGTVIASTGDAPSDEIWREVTARPATVVEFGLGDWHVLATPVAAGGGAAGWLAVASRRRPASRRLARQAARATAPVLAALTRIDGVAWEQQLAIRAALLDEMLEPPPPREQPATVARAASLGIDFDVPARLVLVARRFDATRASPEGQLDEAFARLTAALAARGVAYLATRRSGAVAVLVQARHEDLRADLARAIDGLTALVVGVGRPASDTSEVLESYRDARIAVQRLERDSRARILDFEDFDLLTLLIGEARREGLQAKLEEVMAVIRGKPSLHDALAAYFAHGLDVMSAAKAMHLHHNTLRYRLGRVEDALGRPLKDPATIALLYVALAAEQTERSAE